MYRLRWRFDFAKRPPAFGMWNTPGTHSANQAWCQNKEGLLKASVEAQDMKTRETKLLAEISGQDFRNFQWMAVGRMVGFPGPGCDKVKPVTSLVGLRIIGRYKEYEVFGSGKVVEKDIAPAHETLNFATYGK